MSEAAHSGHLQRKCACGGECPECQKRSVKQASAFQAPTRPHGAPAFARRPVDSPERRLGHDFSRVRVHDGSEISNVQRSTVQRDKGAPGQTGAAPCTTTQVSDTNKAAEAGRVAGRASVANAVRALGMVATPELVCAFASNFNTPGTDPAFQTRRLIVGRFLSALANRMNTAVGYTCRPGDDPVCTQNKTADTVAYVMDHKPPINFCPTFRDSYTGDPEPIVIHEYAHLVSNIDDSGGYAFNGLGAETAVTDCGVGFKFKATGDVLIHTADALTGFVLNLRSAGTSAPPSGRGGSPGQTAPPGNPSP